MVLKKRISPFGREYMEEVEEPPKRPQGRPGLPVDQRRRNAVTVMLTDSEYATVEGRARERGYGLAAYVRAKLFSV